MKKTKTERFSENRLVFMSPTPAEEEAGLADALAGKSEAEKVKGESKKDLTKNKSDVERSALKRATDAKSALENLDIWNISVIRRSKPEINADDWGISSKKQLEEVKKDWETLEIFEGNSPFYTKLFKTLGQASDEKFLGGKSEDERLVYRNPLKYPDKLRNLQDEDFINAVNFFKAMKKTVLDQDVAQKNTDDVLQNRTKEPITTAIGNGIRSNVSAIKEAVANGDWATVGVYAAGAYGMYRLWKMLPDTAGENGKGSMFNKGFLGKLLFGGIALYAGDKVLKNAGIDVAAKLGLKDAFSELKDTPLVSFGDYQIPGGEKVDTRVLRDAAFINMGDLHRQLKEAKTSGVPNFIDPNQFPSTFSDKFRGMHPSDLTGPGSKAGKLAEYRRVGENLYLIAKSLKYAYEKAEMNKGIRKGMSYESAVMNDPTLKNSTIFDFLVQLQQHALNTRESASIVGTKGAEKIRERLKKVLKVVTYNVDSGELKPGYYQATIKGYPVVIAMDRTGELVVFARDEYEKKGGNPTKSMAKIPLKGDASKQVENLNLFINKRMKDLMSNFAKTSGSGAKFTKLVPEYRGGKWYTQIQYERGRHLSIKPEPMDVTVEAGLTGTSLIIRNMRNEKLLVVNNVLDHGRSYGNAVLAEMTNQTTGTNFSALKRLLPIGGINYVDTVKNDDNFYISIPGVSIDGSDKFEIKATTVTAGVAATASAPAVPATMSYDFVDAGLQTKLIQNEAFRMKFAEAVGMDNQINGPINQFKGLLVKADESFAMNFITSIPSWFKEFTLANPVAGVKARHFTGAITAEYASTLIDAQKQALLYRVSDSIGKASNFGEIEGKMNLVVPRAITDLNALVKSFSEEVNRKKQKNDDFKAAEFDAKVMDQLATVGLASADYKLWYKGFLGRLVVRFGNDKEKIAACLRVYAYETTGADDPDQDGSDLQAPKLLSPVAPATVGAINPEWTKAELFRKNAAKCEHVAKQIFLRLNTLGDRSIPGPGQAWNINSNPASYTVNNEYNDVSPRLKEFKDYIEFDVYLEKIRKGDVVDTDKVMLPKKDCTFVFNDSEKDAYRLYLKLINAGVVNSNGANEAEVVNAAFTELEKNFSALMLNALNKLRHDYPTYRVPAFDGLAKRYSVTSNVKMEPSDATLKVTYTYQKNESFNNDIKSLKMEMSTIKGTLTRKVQTDIIKARVAKIIEEQIFGDFDTYFDRKTLGKSASEIWSDIKTWIFGNPLAA